MENSFTLHAASRRVMQMLRAKVAATPDAAAELHAAMDQIEMLWRELQTQAEALAAERQRYSSFFEYAPDAYLVTEAHGEMREANRAARELLGLPQEALDGTSLVSFIPESDRPGFRGKLVMTRGRPEGEQEEWPGRIIVSGTELPVFFRVRPIKVRRKNSDGLCWLVRRT